MLKNKLPIVIFIIFCFFLTLIWFNGGELLATGEGGLIFANPKRSVELYQHTWSELGPGITSFDIRPFFPVLYLGFLFSKIIQPWVFQAGVFFVLLLTGSVSIFILSKELFVDKHKKNGTLLGFIAGIFYLLNPISLLGVWYRFIYPFMFFFALAPLFLYLFVKGLNRKDFRFVFITPIITLPLSLAFGSPPLAILLWLLPFLFTTVFLLKHFLRSKTIHFFPFFYFIFTFVFWTLVNLWWIIPYSDLLSSPLEFAAQKNIIYNIGTLTANSKDFTLINVLRLIHGGFLYRAEVFGPVYKHLFFKLLSWLIPLASIYGIYKIKNKNLKVFFVISFLTVVFFSKGTSAPFGGVFLWLFTHISPMQLFRNPLEKFGLLLPVVYAPLFGLGITSLVLKMKRSSRGVTLFFVILFLVVFHWPFFTGAMATFDSRDIRVTVPESFNDFDNFMEGKDHRILNQPFMGGASGFYNWKHLYAGIEPSESLFKYPVISRVIFGNTFFDDLIIGVSKGDAGNNLVGIAQIFSTDLIAFRKDTNVPYYGGYPDALERTEKMIKDSNVKKIFDSKEFSMWRLNQEDVVPVIYSPSSLVFGHGARDLLDLLKRYKFSPKKQAFVCIGDEKCNPTNDTRKLSTLEVGPSPREIRFSKVSSSEYNVQVFGSTGKFLLVFANSYHPNWQVILDDKVIPEENHIVVDGYANGFIVNKKGNFDLKILFKPEERDGTILQYSLWSILVSLICVFVLSFQYAKK